MCLRLLLTLKDHTKSNRAVIMDIVNRVALVVGPADYCGVNKKTMFTVMNYVLPSKGQLSMHCSANVGADDSCYPFRSLWNGQNHAVCGS